MTAERSRGIRMRRFLHHWPFASGTLSIGIGVFVWAGWLLGHPRWTTIAPEFPATTVNTALMAILAGTSLLLCAPGTASRRRAMFGKLFAGVVALIAGSTLAQHLFGVDFGIDRMLVASTASGFDGHPGRPAPQTAMAFTLIASALLAIDTRTSGGKRPTEFLALFAGTIPLVALLGYLFGTEGLYRAFALSPFVGMGIATAVALLALSTGILAVRAETGLLSVTMADDSGGFAARQAVGSLAVFAIVMGVIATGARVGFYDASIAAPLIVLAATVAGSAFVLRVTARLSQLDAERATSQKQLRQSQERLDLALRGADLAAWDWNIKTGEVIYSPRWAEMRGYRPDEIEPRVETWKAGLHPDDRPRVEKALADYFEGRTPEYESEHRVRTKSGDWIWSLGRGKVFERDDQGRPVRAVGTSLDITERKRLEAELRLAEAKSSGILSISSDAIISIDERQRITSFNEGAATIFGYSKDEVIGEPIEMFFPERFRHTHRRHVDGFAAGRETSRQMGTRAMSIFGLRKNGEEFPADAAISKLEVGGTRILTVSLRDDTERQRRETEKTLLAEVGGILTSSLDHEQTLPRMGQVVTESFADLCFVDLSRDGDVHRLCVATRNPSHTWIIDALMEPSSYRARQDIVRSVIETWQPRVARDVPPESLAPSARGATLGRLRDALGPASVLTVPLLAREKILGAATFVRSSASKAYDPADVRFAEEIAERTALAIENGQLYRAAQRAIQTRDDVLGVVAHDLRNPLGTILVEASFLALISRDGDSRAVEPTQAIVRTAKRMSRLIKDLLDVTLLEAGRFAIQFGRVDTSQLLADVMEAQKTLVASDGLELRLEAAPNLPDVNADRDRLFQVFENLIGNAMKFTEAGGRITIAAMPREGDILLSVTDTGTGIEPEDVPHLFDRFWQARGTEKEGAGLGLPIVKGIVEAHGGRIWVKSTPLRGSTFSFTIPLHAVVDEPGQYPAVRALEATNAQ